MFTDKDYFCVGSLGGIQTVQEHGWCTPCPYHSCSTQTPHSCQAKYVKISGYSNFGGCTVVWWLALSPHSERVPGSTPGWGLSLWSLHVLPVYKWDLSGYSGFLPPFKNMHVRSIGVSKIVLRSVCVWLFVLFVSFVSVWPCDEPAQGVPRLSPDDCWDRPQPPCNPTNWLSGYRKWMDSNFG